MTIRRLHVIGAIVIAIWLATLGWLVWRERHSSGAASGVERVAPGG